MRSKLNKTVLITGSSAGIGKVTAEFFAKNNWNVIATMRNPEKRELVENPNITYMHLDVTDNNSIKEALVKSIEKFKKIDVIINNAGYGLYGIFESINTDQIRKQYDTNVFGVMNVIRHILPHFRENKSGCIINVSSMGGLIGFPLYSLYQGSKHAIEGFTESLFYELQDLNIKVKLIEPGVIKTNFYSDSLDSGADNQFPDYENFEKLSRYNDKKLSMKGNDPVIVAQSIYKAAVSKSYRLRHPSGNDAWLLFILRKVLPFGLFRIIIRATFSQKIKN